MQQKRVLSAGQCMADHGRIADALGKAFQVEIVSAETIAETVALLRKGTFALVLLNRVFDLDGSSGMDCLKAIKAEPDLAAVPVMLVSNFADAQAQAEAAGAVPGFGKASLKEPDTLNRLKSYLGGNE